MGASGTPPPRIVISSISPDGRTRPNRIVCWLPPSALVSLNWRPAPGATACPPAPCRW
jgi:hypothetical protein